MLIKPLKIDERTFSKLVETLLSMVPHYTPEWTAPPGEAGTALLKIHAFITEMIITRFNQVPRKSFIAFLDMLGIKLLPAQYSRVPITFKLVQGATEDILVPARTQASADKTAAHDEVPFETAENLLAVASSLKEVISVDPATDTVYVHTPNVVATDGKIKDLQDAFSLFSGTDQQEHGLYLGNKDILNMKGTGEITLAATVSPAPGSAALDLVWEYWGEDKAKKVERWISLEVKSEGTDGFRQNGEIVLYKGLEGEIKEVKLQDIFKATGRVEIKDAAVAATKNRWLRCRLQTPLTPDLSGRLPAIDTLLLKTAPIPQVPVDGGFANDVALDFTKAAIEAHIVKPTSDHGLALLAAAPNATVLVDTPEGFKKGDNVEILSDGAVLAEATITAISAGQALTLSFFDESLRESADTIRTVQKLSKALAFGSQPKLYDSFFIASKEAFSKKGAKISLTFSLSIANTVTDLTPLPVPRLAWEYWDGRGWQALAILKDDTIRLQIEDDEDDGSVVEFLCPEGIQETEVFGQKNYWVRARLIGGDYGREQYKVNPDNTISISRQFTLPVIRDLAVGYAFDETKEFEVCLSYNNLDFEDRSVEATTANLFFSPVTALPDAEKGLYLGFDKQLREGPIRLFFDAQELQYRRRAEARNRLALQQRPGLVSPRLSRRDRSLCAPGTSRTYRPRRFHRPALF